MVTPTADDLWLEAQWEAEGLRRAVQRYREAASVADPSTLPSGQRLLRATIPPLRAKIIELQGRGMDTLRRGGGRVATRWSLPIQQLPADALALITVSRSLRGAEDPDMGAALTNLSADIAQAVRDEIDYRGWVAAQTAANKAAKAAEERDKPDLLAAFRRRYPAADQRAWRRFQRNMEMAPTEWDRETSIQLGGALLHALVEAVPTWFEVATRRLQGGRSQNYLRMSDEASATMRDVEARAEIARPQLMPMLIPPIPWAYDAVAE